MKQQRNYLFKLFLVLWLALGPAVIISVKSTPALAATPGCYIYDADAKAYSRATCGDTDILRVVNQEGVCFVNTKQRVGESGFVAVDCANITDSPAADAEPAPDQLVISGLKTGDEGLDGKYTCGKGTRGDGNDVAVKVSFNFGCRGSSYGGNYLNPIIDIAFAIFRFLSAGVGLIVIGSIIVAGIQYTTSQGNPQATEAAIKRIASSLTALLLFIFMFALANFLVPGGLFK